MIRYLIKTAIFLGIISGILFAIDNSFTISFLFNKEIYEFSVGETYCIVLGALSIVSIIVLALSQLVQLIKKDVLISNYTYLKSKGIESSAPTMKKNTIVLSRNQFDEAAILIVKTMAAISTGTTNDARKLLVSLRKIIGNDAVIDILMMKLYKAEKNFDKMEEISKKLMQNEDIQLVGMKAALEAQIQKKEFTEALKTVNQAFEVRQDLYWVISSAFLLRAKNDDWLGALEVLQSGIDKNLIPDSKAKRLKTVALYELAKQAQKENDNVNFFKFITQTLDENNKFIPAAIDLAEYYIKNDDQKTKAQKVLYDIWVENPSYEVAIAYLKLFKNDTNAEKIARMERLAKVNSKNPSLNNLLLAELYLKVKKYDKAKIECKLFLLKNPATEKMAEIIKSIDEKKYKKKQETIGVMKSIAQKLIHTTDTSSDSYPKDFQWVCANCGHVEDSWLPICPKCSEIGRNYWHLYVDKDAPSSMDI